jgi:hypothetical protein
MGHASATLAAGLTVLAVVLALTLTRSPLSVAATNAPSGAVEEPVASTRQSTSYCQGGERLPRDVSAIRLWLAAATGPRVTLTASSGGRLLTGGVHGSGWSGGSVTVAVRALPRSVSGVTLCASFPLRDETVEVQGNAAPAAAGIREGGRSLPARMWIEYLRSSSSSWLSLIPSVLRHMSFGHALPGRWSPFTALALFAAAGTLAAGAAFRALR